MKTARQQRHENGLLRAENVRLTAALAARDEEVRRMREELAWCVSVIEHEVEPPESCGGCGTPSGNCDGECADAYYFADHMRKARALTTPAPAKSPTRNAPCDVCGVNERDDCFTVCGPCWDKQYRGAPADGEKGGG